MAVECLHTQALHVDIGFKATLSARILLGILTALASQIDTVLSAEQVRTEFEKGMNLTEFNESACPRMVTKVWPLYSNGLVTQSAITC